jgi:aldehyde dehydrogenase (NAD+)
MAVTQAVSITRHPYADGSYKKMLIDGKWVDAASGRTFETLNAANRRGARERCGRRR